MVRKGSKRVYICGNCGWQGKQTELAWDEGSGEPLAECPRCHDRSGEYGKAVELRYVPTGQSSLSPEEDAIFDKEYQKLIEAYGVARDWLIAHKEEVKSLIEKVKDQVRDDLRLQGVVLAKQLTKAFPVKHNKDDG